MITACHNCPITLKVLFTNYPARACASKGLCDRSWCLYIIYYISARTFFYLSKYSLSDAHFSTGRLLFEFNRLQYTLAAPEVFVSSANLQLLLFCRLGTGSASSETQTFTRSKPHPYGIARQIRLNTPTRGSTMYYYTLALGLIGSVCHPTIFRLANYVWI